MAHPEHHPGHNPEKFESHIHPIIQRAREVEATINTTYYAKGGIAQTELEQYFAVGARQLTQDAKDRGLFNRPVVLSGDSLRLPAIIAGAEPSLGSVPAPRSREEQEFGQLPTFRGPFVGFRYTAGVKPDEYYLTAQVLAYETHTADGDFKFYASCQVGDASLEFPHETRAAQVERSLRIINSQLPFDAEATFQRLHNFVREQSRAGRPLNELLPHLALQADRLGSRDEVRANAPLRQAVLDLLTEELQLPRTMDIHQRPYDLDTLNYLTPSTSEHWGESQLNNVRPELAYGYNGRLARLCFAVIHRGKVAHVPLRSILNVIEYPR